MCGICGAVTARNGPPDPELILAMMNRLHHRGPDGRGYFRDERALLGHTRLAIIDRAGGTQPLANENESIWITFNGEIFNYVELTAELKALGHRFSTSSDTEVIIHAWEEWGHKCLGRFNGQWAFALWDRRTGELALSRDPSGIVPLHYAFADGKFIFASEVKALFADPTLGRGFDPEGLDEILTFWIPVAPRTPYRGISELPPGHWALLSNGRLRIEQYHRHQFPPTVPETNLSIEENGAELRRLLIEATKLRFLRSDVPVGAYLSGGIDSSVTAAIICTYTDAPLRTFSLRFEEGEFDEGAFQNEMATRLGTEHTDVRVSSSDIANVFPEVVWHAERPILRAGPAPMFLLSKFVRSSGYKVVVTGEGSDEMLGGYDIFREAMIRRFWARDPSSAQRARAAELLYPWMDRSPGKAPAFAQAFFGRNLDPQDPALSHRPRWDSTAALKGMLTEEFRLAEGNTRVDEALVSRMPADCAEWSPLARAQWLELNTILPGYILSSQGDRMLMGNSVEGRFPFLDPDFANFAHGLPHWQKLLALDEKHILKKTFADLVPETILRRPKQPYRAPDAAAFFAPGAPDWITDLVFGTSVKDAGIFNPAMVRSLFEKCSKVGGSKMSNTDNMRVVAVLSTQLLHEQFIVRGGSAERFGNPQGDLAVFDRTSKK